VPVGALEITLLISEKKIVMIGKLQEACEIMREVIDIMVRQSGKQSLDYADAVTSYATMLFELGIHFPFVGKQPM
jgi:hypothetical protein